MCAIGTPPQGCQPRRGVLTAAGEGELRTEPEEGQPSSKTAIWAGAWWGSGKRLAAIYAGDHVAATNEAS